jgi:D-sedoheptulose 7-phosphate isomerase
MIDAYFNNLTDTLDRVSTEQITKVVQLISECKGSIFVFGNGGSSSTASHFCQDMSKCLDYKFICLNDNVPLLTAYANDVNYSSIFKLQLSKLAEPGDLVIGISCSGDSENVLSAIIYAKHFGYMTIGFTGFSGGRLKELVDYYIHVPSNDMQICEDVHLVITHTILKLLK